MPRFIGEYKYNLDSKGRVIIPGKFRENFTENVYLLKGFEKCLLLLDSKEIKKIEDRISKRSLVDKEVRDFTRAFFSGITEVKTDSQGRILLSRSLLEYAEITEEVYLVGTGFYLEIWSSKNWLIESKKLQALRKELIRLIGEDEK
ncbi:MAG: division/cell wall cluster transcriptional repressor MraZ [Fusobacteria bacterium]|nr:division/cell wall cluster transcriptional repressor MraZ [Fusobacteriota bacterium]